LFSSRLFDKRPAIGEVSPGRRWSLSILHAVTSLGEASMPESWTWNVIWTPNTVRRLEPFVDSLVDWSEHCRFRFVANGCPSDEVALLKKMVARSDRLELEVLSGACRRHGDVLTDLQRRETGRWFAMIDTDIYATSRYESHFVEALAGHDAVFSCSPIWGNQEYSVMPRGFQCMSGVYGRLWDGRVSGMTYCGVYDNAKLNECLESFGVDLRSRSWSQLPHRVQDLFLEHGLPVWHFDTAKVANLLLGITGGRLTNIQPSMLTHLGGISSLSRNRRPLGGSRLARLRGLYARLPKWVRRWGTHIGLHADWRAHANSRELLSDEIKRVRRQSSCLHVAKVLDALTAGQAVGDRYRHSDPTLVAAVEQVCRELELLFETKTAENTFKLPSKASSISAGTYESKAA